MTSLLRDGDANARLRVLLAHGAGAAMDSPFMNEVARALAARGIAVARFEFPYMAARRERGARRPPDRSEVLQEAYRAAVGELGAAERLVIGGKSMGGRIASMVGDELGVAGLLVFGYPFHPPEKPTQLRTAHLHALATPALFVQGTRDEFGSRDEIRGYDLSKNIEFHWVEDGGHDLEPRRRNGHDPSAAFALMIEAAAAFVARVGA